LLRICLQAGQPVSDGVPQDIEVDTVVSVTQSVAHTTDIAPGLARRQLSCFFPQAKGGLANALFGRYFFFEPLGKLSLPRVDQQINFCIYTALGILVSALNEALREAERRARRNQDEAKQSEARVNKILSSITDCFFEMDRDYRVVKMNERASEFLGRPGNSLSARLYGIYFRLLRQVANQRKLIFSSLRW
jgi:PAS domain-containing protein